MNQPDEDFPFGRHFYIIQDSKPCDILCPFKKNSFTISGNREKDGENDWKVTEESNYCINWCCCQYRSMKLSLRNGQNNAQIYEAERPEIQFCNNILMKIKKQGEENEIGNIQAVSQEQVIECKREGIRNPCLQITQRVNINNKNTEKIFIISKDRDVLHNFYKKQCGLPYSILQYRIFKKNDDGSIKNQKFKQIGSITNQFQGYYKEYCTRGDLFEIDLLEKDLGISSPGFLLIFGCLQLNYQEFEQMFNCL